MPAAIDFSSLPDQQAAPSIDFSGLPDQAQQPPAQAPQASPADAYMPSSIMSPQEEKQSVVDVAQQHPFMAGLLSSPAGMIPHSWEDVKQMVTLPTPSGGVIGPKDEQWGAAIRGEYGPEAQGQTIGGTALQALPLFHLPFAESPLRAAAEVRIPEPVKPVAAPEAQPPPIERVSPETGQVFTVDPKTGETIVPQQAAQPQAAPQTIPSQDEFARELPSQQAGGAENVPGQQRQAPNTGESSVGQPENQGVGGERGYSPESQTAGTSNRQNVETYGENVVPSGTGVDTLELLDNARAAIRSGSVDPYSVLSRTRQKGIANPEEYAALAAEHERLVNDAVAKQKTGDPSAPQAAQQAEDFANAIQPHKTAASDLMRLFQGDLNYDLSTPFGMDQYMKAELGRGMKPSEAPKFNRMSNDINRGEADVRQAVSNSDARVQNRYAKVRDIPIEEAAARVKQALNPCAV